MAAALFINVKEESNGRRHGRIENTSETEKISTNDSDEGEVNVKQENSDDWIVRRQTERLTN